MSRKKILFVNGHMKVGGVEKSLANLLCALDYKKYDVDLLLLEGGGTYLDHIPHEVNVIVRDTTYTYGPFLQTLANNLIHGRFNAIIHRLTFLLGEKASSLIRHTLKINKTYDVAIAYRMGEPAKLVSQIAKANHKVCWWHNGECNYSQNEKQQINKLWNDIDCVVAVSKASKDTIAQTFEITDNRICVIPNIIDKESITHLADTPDPYPKDNKIRIVTLGRLCWEKHIEDVPIIAKKLIESMVPPFIWYIIGDGAKKEEIQRSIIHQDVNHVVKMLGSKDNPYPYLKYADMMVHTSHVEAHCITLLEAMTLGIPCVATKTVLPQDFTHNKENCLLADPTIESQLEKTIEMITNLSEMKRMEEIAQKMVEEKYSSQAIVNLFYSMLNKLT